MCIRDLSIGTSSSCRMAQRAPGSTGDTLGDSPRIPSNSKIPPDPPLNPSSSRSSQSQSFSKSLSSADLGSSGPYSRSRGRVSPVPANFVGGASIPFLLRRRDLGYPRQDQSTSCGEKCCKQVLKVCRYSNTSREVSQGPRDMGWSRLRGPFGKFGEEGSPSEQRAGKSTKISDEVSSQIGHARRGGARCSASHVVGGGGGGSLEERGPSTSQRQGGWPSSENLDPPSSGSASSGSKVRFASSPTSVRFHSDLSPYELGCMCCHLKPFGPAGRPMEKPKSILKKPTPASVVGREKFCLPAISLNCVSSKSEVVSVKEPLQDSFSHVVSAKPRVCRDGVAEEPWKLV
jgi:hypothetical protein